MSGSGDCLLIVIKSYSPSPSLLHSRGGGLLSPGPPARFAAGASSAQGQPLAHNDYQRSEYPGLAGKARDKAKCQHWRIQIEAYFLRDKLLSLAAWLGACQFPPHRFREAMTMKVV
jgi:hypothetical protein